MLGFAKLDNDDNDESKLFQGSCNGTNSTEYMKNPIEVAERKHLNFRVHLFCFINFHVIYETRVPMLHHGLKT